MTPPYLSPNTEKDSVCHILKYEEEGVSKLYQVGGFACFWIIKGRLIRLLTCWFAGKKG